MKMMRYNRRLLISLAAIEVFFAIFPLFILPPLASSSTTTTDNKASPQEYPSPLFEETNKGNEQQQQSTNRRTQGIAPLNIFLLLKDHFNLHRPQLENFVFQSLRPFSTTNTDNQINYSTAGKPTLPSRMYTYDDFFNTLQTMAVDGIFGNSFHRETNPWRSDKVMGNNEYVKDESNKAFYLSQDLSDFENEEGMTLAIVNTCAFLANVMVESIQFDACDEWNGMMTGFDPTTDGWGGVNNDDDKPIKLNELSAVNGRYFPASNACGQNGRLYQEEEEDGDCSINDVDVSCPVDPLMDMRATVHPKYNYIPGKTVSEGFRNQPPPEFACGKKDYEGDYPGYWDGYTAEFVQDVAYPAANGRIDVEGCCFWGRGALQTKGTCALGKFNYYFGKRAYDEDRPARYPTVDFCKIPSVLCNTNVAQYGGVVYPELRWMVAFHQWIEGVQSYSNDDTKWEYLPQLKLLVGKGLLKSDVRIFIDKVSSVLTRGCDEYFCSPHTINFLEQRRDNFETLIYDIFKLGNGRLEPEPPPFYDYEYAEKWLHLKRPKIEGNILTSKHHELGRVQYYSQAYRFLPFISALRTTAKYGAGDGRYFFVADPGEGLRGFNAGLVNLAAFLANAMAESIDHDSCEEFHWEKDIATGRYAISNSCGQNGRNYGTESCPPWQSFMTCPAATDAELQASIPETSEPPFRLGPKPPPFQCMPKSNLPSSGFWEEPTNTLDNNANYPNSYGRTDVEGCSFWGRGVLHTRGTCNFGKFNFHVGARAAAQNRPSLYPDLDFCSDPGLICSDEERTMDIRWVVGMFEWIDRVQDYYDSALDWNYMRELYKYVDGGMSDDSFIDKVNLILARGCHLYPCSSYFAVESDRFLYSNEKRTNFRNILKLLFELPLSEASSPNTPAASGGGSSFVQPSEPVVNRPPTKPPTVRPTTVQLQTPSPVKSVTTNAPTILPVTAEPTTPRVPTGSPIELSDITQWNDGETHVINSKETSFLDESIVVTRGTTFLLEPGGYVEAPLNTNWPAVRLSIGSMFAGTGGAINGSYADPSFLEGEYADGGDGLHINNGQSSDVTGSKGSFFDGVVIVGGDAPIGVGGNALYVNGFGSEAKIYGGSFVGGKGAKDNGYSILVQNSAKVHVYSGSFDGEIKVDRSAEIIFYGCFKRDRLQVSGTFPDETYLDVSIRTSYGGEITLTAVSEQECETAPSMSPTNFPTVSPRPTPKYNHGDRKTLSFVEISLSLASMLLFGLFWI
eukprot:scaffold9914_cov142-Skeletonema_marinoi.AAC.1